MFGGGRSDTVTRVPPLDCVLDDHLLYVLATNKLIEGTELWTKIVVGVDREDGMFTDRDGKGSARVGLGERVFKTRVKVGNVRVETSVVHRVTSRVLTDVTVQSITTNEMTE